MTILLEIDLFFTSMIVGSRVNSPFNLVVETISICVFYTFIGRVLSSHNDQS